MLRRGGSVEDLISKKDLLKETGISYGQLYRWKREKLIPEDWFIKQASSTGQETFFKRTQILNRVHRIIELKDHYSLEEMAGMLSPEIIDRTFTEEELEQFEEIDIDVAARFMDLLEKDAFRFREIILMMALSKLKHHEAVLEADMEALIPSIIHQLEALATLDYMLACVKIDGHCYALLYADVNPPLLDSRFQHIAEIGLQELSNSMKIKYQNVFHFTFD